MNKALLRQLKRTIGIGDEAALAAYLDTLSSCATGSDPALQGLLSGFADLLQRVDASYEQYDRDLELRTRSLELSSRELSSSNDKLRSELISRENALGSLRDAIFGLLPANEGRTETLLEDNIESLSRRIAELVADGEKGRLALANQKFALDQHAIVSITDTNGIIVYANDRFCEISGYSQDELIGKNHRMVKSGIHPRKSSAKCGERSNSATSGMAKSATVPKPGIATGSARPSCRYSAPMVSLNSTLVSVLTSATASGLKRSFATSSTWLRA